MKLIATSDFRNTHKLKVPGCSDPLHIHKGAEFEIDEKDAAVANLVAQLGAAGRVVDYENQPEAYKRIKAEVAADEKKAAQLEKEAAKTEKVDKK